MQITLETSEVTALVDALNWYIPQLREEIGKTESYEMREDLKVQEATLANLVTRLGGKVAGSEGSDLGVNRPPWGS